MTATGRKVSVRTSAAALLYLTPFMIGVTIFKLWPLINVVWVSFQKDYNYLTGKHKGFGLGNYTKILSDRFFLQAVGNTLVYTVIVVASVLIISLIVAWCMLRVRRGLALFQVMIFLPFITSDIAIGMAWRIIFSDHGVLNYLLELLHIEPIGWLTDTQFSLWSLILYGVWSGIPMTVLILYSSMLSINQNLFTAARAGGAGEMKILLRVAMPLLMPSLLMTFSLNCISALLTFSGLYALFGGQPGPYYNLYMLTYYVYDESMSGKYGLARASAAACVLLCFVLLFLALRYLVVPLMKKRRRRTS